MAEVCEDADKIELRVPCKPEYVRTVRALVGELADGVPLPPQAVEEVKIATSEAVANIVRHAYEGEVEPEPIIVRCSRACGTLTVEVIDRGIGFEAPAPSATPDISKEGGLGILLMRGLMDQVDYWSRPNFGTRIKMTKLALRGSRNGRKVTGDRLQVTGPHPPAGPRAGL